MISTGDSDGLALRLLDSLLEDVTEIVREEDVDGIGLRVWERDRVDDRLLDALFVMEADTEVEVVVDNERVDVLVALTVGLNERDTDPLKLSDELRLAVNETLEDNDRVGVTLDDSEIVGVDDIEIEPLNETLPLTDNDNDADVETDAVPLIDPDSDCDALLDNEDETLGVIDDELVVVAEPVGDALTLLVIVGDSELDFEALAEAVNELDEDDEADSEIENDTDELNDMLTEGERVTDGDWEADNDAEGDDDIETDDVAETLLVDDLDTLTELVTEFDTVGV